MTNLKFSFLFNDLFYPKSLKTPKCPKNVTILGTLDFLVFVTGVLLLFVAFLGHRSGHLNRLPKMPIILESKLIKNIRTNMALKSCFNFATVIVLFVCT